MNRARAHHGARVVALLLLVGLTVLASACGASRAYKGGQRAASAGDWELAVAQYREALLDDPDRAEYKIALERAMQSASLFHLERARRADESGDLETAVAAYRRVYEYDPGNRTAMLRAAEIDRVMRERSEAARPRPSIEAMRETARQRSAPPLLDPTSRDPLVVNFVLSSAQDVITTIGKMTGINVVFEPQFQDRRITIDLDGLPLEDALAQVMAASGTFFKVINPKTILVIPDTPPKRTAYEEIAVRTFYLSHADAAEVLQTVTNILQIPNIPQAPRAVVNKTQNSITVRASTRVMNIIEQIIANNDRPRAEIVVDVEILEVNRSRARELGINLSQYSVGSIFSPEAPPSTGTVTGGGGTTTAPFNLNTITRGISTADFYMTVPQAVANFLASDNTTRVIAKPQLRGQEGGELTLDLGDEIPVPSTTFGGFAAGGVSTVPISSFNYKTVGIKVIMNKPRVTLEGEIITALEVESSTLGQSINIAGQSLPTFGTRRVKTMLRLRDGESHMLAGLIRDEQRRDLSGIPGLLRTPLLRWLFGSSSDSVNDTDIVFLLTPRLVRTSEITQTNLDPIYIGSQQNIGMTGAPPLIAAPDAVEPADAAPATAAPGGVPAPQPFSVLPGQPQAGPVLAEPGVLPAPAPAPAVAAPPAQPPVAPESVPPAQPPAAEAAPPEATGPAPGPTARVTVTTPGPQFQMGGGPYTVPISVVGAQRMSTISLTVTYNPAVLRVRSVQEGTFLQQGGVQPTFTQQVDASAGRVDIAIVRTADRVGATGSGLLAALVFEPVAAGQSAVSVAGVAANPDQGSIGLQLVPANVTVR